VRIIRLANFVAPHSGGLRTSLAELGAGYLTAGHEPVLVIPGDRDGDERCAQGRVITLRAPRVPFTGGYRVLWRRRRLARLLAALRPDALEVSDRTTLRWTGAWAREHGVPAVMVSHESVTALLKLTLLGPGRLRSALSRGVADWLNRRTARSYHRVICTTGWAAAEFGRIDAGNVVRVPLGVDLDTFSSRVRRVRTQYAGEGQILLVHCGRLSAEKRGPVFPARISRPACGPCWPGRNGPGGPPPAPARSSTTGARPRAASWRRTGPGIARPEGGDPHDAVRGAGRLDHGGHGRPGTRT
jgi:alpha-1,6-mannosyltransferase